MTREELKDFMFMDSVEDGDLKVLHLTTAYKWIDKLFDDLEIRACRNCKHYQDENKESLQGYCNLFKRRENRRHSCNRWESKNDK